MTHSALQMDNEFLDYTAYESCYNGVPIYGTVDLNHLASLRYPGYEAPLLAGGTDVGVENSLDAILQRVRQSLVCEEWRKLIIKKDAATDTVTLQLTADRAFSAIHLGGPASIDLLLLQDGEVNGEHLAMLLRCIAVWHNEMPGWDRAIAIAKSALTIEGKDAEDALFGIL